VFLCGVNSRCETELCRSIDAPWGSTGFEGAGELLVCPWETMGIELPETEIAVCTWGLIDFTGVEGGIELPETEIAVCTWGLIDFTGVEGLDEGI